MFQQKEQIINIVWIASELTLLNVAIYFLLQYSVLSILAFISILVITYISNEGRMILNIINSLIKVCVDHYEELKYINQKMIDTKFRVILIISWIHSTMKKMLELREHAPTQFCAVACTSFAFIAYVGSTTMIINFLYLAAVFVNLIRERTEKFRQTSKTLTEAADVSLLRFEAHMKRESEDIYDDIVLSDEFHSDEGSDSDPTYTPTNVRKYKTENKFSTENSVFSPVLQLTDQKENNAPGINIQHDLERAPYIELGEEAFPNEPMSTSEVTKSTRKKKLFSFGTHHEEFDPIEMKMEPGSPRSTVKKQISSSKSLISFLSRHK